MERFCELKQKEVINIKDGCRFGFICDLEIDLKCGEIIKIIIPVQGRVFCVFGREKEYRIPWRCIKKIGEDIILVDVEIEHFIVECD